MTAPPLGSILLGTADRDRLRAWYRSAFEPKEDEFGTLQFGEVGILIDGRDDVAARNAQPGRTILNFHVDDIAAVAAHLDSLEVEWLVRPEDRGPGIFGTVVDPDGNYVQIIQFSKKYLERRR